MKELNFDFCVKALTSSLFTGRSALQTEIAIGLLVFHSHGSADIFSKKALRSVYALAGEDCEAIDGSDYKTIMRRTDRVAKLYYKLGARKIKKFIAGLTDMNAVDALKEFIAPLELKNMEAVSEYCADPDSLKTVNATKAEKKLTRRATDQPGVVHFVTKNCRVDVPPEAREDELLDLANKLIALAHTLKKAA